MFILYVLECMMLVLTSVSGGIDSSPMFTTGENPTGQDIAVGIIIWIVLAIIICFSIFLIGRHIKKKKLIKLNEEKERQAEIIKEEEKIGGELD
ncbi:MAG: hypothetical protein FWE84_04740 [Firmicutes bacterium]|nr:hypothetical protein [Bacillota bacterium]